MGDVRQWLQSLGLGQYADVFDEHAIEWNHLADLDHHVLKDLGVEKVGHRLTLIRAARVVPVPDDGRAVVADVDTRSEPPASPANAERRLVEGRVTVHALAPRQLKGVSEPVRSYRVEPVRAGSRIAVAAARGLSAMAGRDADLGLIAELWTRAARGEGYTLTLRGEAGIGKSRLLQEFLTRSGCDAANVIHYQCSPFHTGSAFHPVIEQIQRTAKFASTDSAAQRFRKLANHLDHLSFRNESALPLVAAMLSLPADGYPPLEMSPQRQKKATIEVLVDMVAKRTGDGSVLLILEDAHWIDPSTQEFLDALVAQTPSLPLLNLVTGRPEYGAPFDGAGNVVHHQLDRLDDGETGRIIDHLAGGKPLPPEIVRLIVDKTDGVPLFVEELTKSILEDELVCEADERYELSRSLEELNIPATLHDSLLARLDRLGAVKEVAQVAACIGREFSPELLGAVTAAKRRKLDKALDRLVAAELIYRQHKGETAGYVFKHALVQDAAYTSLLLSRRRAVHARIALVLEERFAEIRNTEPERLAHHFTAAGIPREAIPYWVAAGRRALARSSLPEAISHLTRALELTPAVDSAAARAGLALKVRTVLGTATAALRGWPSSEVREAVAPACDLFERGRGSADDFVNFWNLWLHHGCRAEHTEGLEVVERMHKHASRKNDPVLAMIASFTAAMAHLWVGNYDQALVHETRALGLYRLERDRSLAAIYNHDPRNTLLSWASNRLWAQGYPDTACELSDAAVEHARKIGNSFNLCWTLGNSSFAFANSGRFGPARDRIDEMRKLARQQELVFMESYMVPASHCHVAALEGDHRTAYELGLRAEQVWRSVGGRFYSPVITCLMANSCLQLGRVDDASDLIQRTIDEIEATGEMMHAEEIYRVAGLVYLAKEDEVRGTMDYYRKSLELANLHGTRSFALRTCIDIATLWRDRGRNRKAHELLAGIHGQFKEGLDTRDHKKAATLLAELS